MQLLDILLIDLEDTVRHAVFPLIPLAMAAWQIGSSIVKEKKAKKAEQEAIDAMESYNRKTLKNVYRDNEYYSQRSRQFAKDMISRNLGTVASASAQMGGRLTGAIGGAQSQADNATRRQLDVEDAAYLSHQNRKSADDAWIRGENSRREDQDLRALGNRAGVENQNQQLARSQMYQGIGSAAAYGYDWQKGGGTIDWGSGGGSGGGVKQPDIPTVKGGAGDPDYDAGFYSEFD